MTQQRYLPPPPPKVKRVFSSDYGILRTMYQNKQGGYVPTKLAEFDCGRLPITPISLARTWRLIDEYHGEGTARRKRIRIRKQMRNRRRRLDELQ